MGVDPDASQSLIEPGRWPDEATGRSARDCLTVFAVLWALATLFHLWVNPSGLGVVDDPTLLGLSHVAAGVASISVLLRPRSSGRLLVLAALGVVTCWLEAPFLGNHWLIAAFVDLALLASAATCWTRDGLDTARLAARFLPLARWSLLAFYAFAAFSKLNHAFFEPAVSCGNFYADELAGSLGFGRFRSADGGGWAVLVPISVVAIEASIPVLLVRRRWRHIGVVVGLVFHSAVALDMTHLFSDFSSVLAALFVLFLPTSFGTDVLALARRHPTPMFALKALAVVAAAVVFLIEWTARGERVFVDGRAWAWIAVDAALLAVVVWYLRRERPAPETSQLRLSGPPWLVVVPLLVVLNGLTPYVELKTAYGWNMYSNLSTIDGETNHLLVPRTWPVLDAQADLVRVVSSSDPGLNLYVTERFDIPFLQLRAYLSEHRDASITYERAGQRHAVAHASEDPDLVRAVPEWQQKLSAFRALDQTEPNRCQPGFLPAH
jgi:hypothetical protein